MNPFLKRLRITPADRVALAKIGIHLLRVSPPATASQLAGNGGKKPPGFVRSPETIERENRRKRAQADIRRCAELEAAALAPKAETP